MRKLSTRFSLALVIVLVIATSLPFILFYGLSASGLIEAAYVSSSEQVSADQRLPSDLSILERERTDNLSPNIRPYPEGELKQDGRLTLFESEFSEDGRLLLPVSRTVVVESPVFRFRVELPAWIAIGILPVLSLILGLVLGIWMGRSVTRPISQLADAAQAIGKRDLSYRVETRGSVELEELAGAFNRMAEELETSEHTRRNLMADVAHELRTPLTVLEGNLRAILDHVHDTSEEEIALLYEQTHHLKRLVKDLGQLSLAEADKLPLNFESVDVAQLMEETTAHFEPLAEEQEIQLSIKTSGDLKHPRLDVNRIRQVMHNLLSNAFQHTPPGGEVSIRACRLGENSGIEIVVSDSGEGISPDDLDHIFDRFYRTETTYSRDTGGAGLGLAIVNAIVEAHGGQVSAHSDGINLGSSFTLVLPQIPYSHSGGAKRRF
jgi:signal transduction histidine kinase